MSRAELLAVLLLAVPGKRGWAGARVPPLAGVSDQRRALPEPSSGPAAAPQPRGETAAALQHHGQRPPQGHCRRPCGPRLPPGPPGAASLAPSPSPSLSLGKAEGTQWSHPGAAPADHFYYSEMRLFSTVIFSRIGFLCLCPEGDEYQALSFFLPSSYSRLPSRGKRHE